MSDKRLLLSEAMGYIDEKFIEEAHSEARGVPYQADNKKRTFRQIAAVACLCLVALGVAHLPEIARDMNVSGEAEHMAPSSPDNKFPFFDFDKNDGNSENAPSSGEKHPVTGGSPEENSPIEETEDAETETAAEA